MDNYLLTCLKYPNIEFNHKILENFINFMIHISKDKNISNYLDSYLNGLTESEDTHIQCIMNIFCNYDHQNYFDMYNDKKELITGVTIFGYDIFVKTNDTLSVINGKNSKLNYTFKLKINRETAKDIEKRMTNFYIFSATICGIEAFEPYDNNILTYLKLRSRFSQEKHYIYGVFETTETIYNALKEKSSDDFKAVLNIINLLDYSFPGNDKETFKRNFNIIMKSNMTELINDTSGHC